MDKDPEMPTTAEGAEEHTALRTTTKRRVSFAETTEIRYFYNGRTSTDSSTPDSNSDQNDDEVEDDCEENGLFVKNMVDSSPGSTFSSATLNEDSNFFGPLSSSFIKSGDSGQLTGVSDNNDNDVTLDSATFSMHFRHLLPRGDMSACSAEILSTPTTNSIPAGVGNFMSITNPIMKNTGAISEQGRNSGSDMSIVAFDSEGYNFNSLSPLFDALVAKSNESLHTISPKSNSKFESSNSSKTHGRDLLNSVNKEPDNMKVRKVTRILEDSNSGSLYSPQLPCPYVSPEALKIGSLAPAKHWKDIFSKVSEIANMPLPFPIDRLSIAEIDMFEEKLSDLQRARKFERICIDIQSVKKPHPLGSEHQKRLAEVKLLQDVFVFEKLKKQLLNAKREKLHEKKQCLQSGIEECNKLRRVLHKNNHSSNVEGHTKNTSLQLTKMYSRVICLEELSKVASLRQELKNMEEKLKQLKTDFEESCNVPENASFDEIINVVRDHIKRRNHRGLIKKKLVLWEFIDVISEGDQCHIHVSYQNLLTQRLTVKAVPGKSLVIRNSINDVNIGKIFPNMGACRAFNFIFVTEYDCTFPDSKFFWQETKRSIIIFSNLLYLLKEVQVVWMQLGNLMSSIFCSSHPEQLELELTFLNQKNGKNVIVSLDMTNLKSGIYPSKPSEWQVRVLDGNKEVLVCNYKDEIMSSIRDIKDKYSAITKLCECVSHIVQSSAWLCE